LIEGSSINGYIYKRTSNHSKNMSVIRSFDRNVNKGYSTMSSRFTVDNFIELFNKLKSYTDINQSGKGITRLAYSEVDEEAHQHLIEVMENAGLTVRQDSMGNVFARLTGKNPDLPAIATGSHIDTVPNGGPLDGTLGVVAGLFAILQFEKDELERDVELIVFRAEESSRFGFSCIGSKTLSGNIELEKWRQNQDDNGINVFQAIEECGYEGTTLEDCILPDNYLDGFVELHIEQGRCLEQEEKTIGVVHGIAAPTRFEISVTGHADHSGATPMGIRSDALVATAELIKNIHDSACRESANGTVGTVGKLAVFPNSMNVIPGSTKFYVDIRGVNKSSIDRVVDSLSVSIQKAKNDNNVKIDLRQISDEEPVVLDPQICNLIEQNCKTLGFTHMRMLSGAGHDAMYMAQKYPTAMIFIPSKDGISHHPDEHSETEDMISSAILLAETLKKLANK